MSRQTVSIDAIRSLSHTGISGSYAAVGIPLTDQVRLICFTNNTDGDMLFSTDGSTDMLFIAAGSFKLFDLTTNRERLDNIWCFPPYTQFYVKQSSAASKNSVYIECLSGGV